MQKRSIRWFISATICTVALAACDSPTATISRPSEIGTPRGNVIPTQPTLDAEIRALVNNAFPKGQATAILAKWDQVLRAIAKEPKMVLKGKLEPGTSGRTELVHTVQYIQLKQSEATPPTGETRDHFIARLVLDMSLYVYGGPTTPPPPTTTNSDVAFEVVNPGTADTVVTPAKQAAVAFAANSVDEPTVVVITPDPTYYPDNCSGPLVTHYCQYPRFYKFNVFPDVRLSAAAKIQVCHVDAGSVRLPLADHDRFVFAHDKPADPADNIVGGKIVDGIEVLPLVTLAVTQCTSDGGTTYTTALAPDAGVFRRLAFYSKKAARFLFVPKDAQAIDVGMGGLTEVFSNFGVVDTLSKPDLAQPHTGAYFAPLHTQLQVGDVAQIQAWAIGNIGSGTSGAFTSDVIVATDSLLTAPVSTVHLNGASSLIPGATFGYPAMNITMPATPGTYFVGTRINSTAADSAKDDDLVSFKMTVNAAGPPGSCAAIHTANPSAPDGDYTIQPGSTPFTVYCYTMSTEPREYLTLVNTGPSSNFASTDKPPYGNIATHWTRYRIDPATLKINVGDVQFSLTSGTGNTSYRLSVGHASGCDAPYAHNYHANVDLRGTPFKIYSTLRGNGFNASAWADGVEFYHGDGSGTTFIDEQNVDIEASGYCGGTTFDVGAPAGFDDGFNLNGVYLSSASVGSNPWALQLAFAPSGPPVILDRKAKPVRP